MTDEPVSADGGGEPPTQPLVPGTVGDRCVACGTPLSSDQRYCVTCGERRGQPRFSLTGDGQTAPSLGSEPAPTAPPPSPARTPRASAGTTIVAGVGTLLLAMGVGVLIGRNSANSVNAKPVQAAAPTVVTVGSGGATARTAASAAPRRATKKKSSSKSTSQPAKTKQAAAKPTAVQAKKASAAASKVLGSKVKSLPPATVTVGQTGTGPGYNKSTHKFDGSFFGQ